MIFFMRFRVLLKCFVIMIVTLFLLSIGFFMIAPLFPPIISSKPDDGYITPEDKRILKLSEFDSKKATASEHYQHYCAPCHGKDGKGDTPTADRLLMKPTDLVSGPFRYRSASFIIKNGVGAMPGFALVLSDEDINALAIYTLSLRRKDGKVIYRILEEEVE